MILRNWYNYLALCVLGTANRGSTLEDGALCLKDTGGTIRNVYGSCENAGDTSCVLCGPFLGAFWNHNSYYTGNSVLMFGNGDTSVTFDDYALASEISNSDLVLGAVTVGTATYNSATKKWSNSRSIVVTNNTSGNITVREVGIAKRVQYSSNYNWAANILFYREVLATPFTINAGETVSYTHNFEFTMPTV